MTDTSTNTEKETTVGTTEPADDLLETSPFDGDLATELAARPRQRVRPGLTMYLGAGVLLVGGFIGGVQAQQRWGAEPEPASGADALQQALASRLGGNQTAQTGQTSQTGNMTIGTIKLVDGKTIYVQTTTGGVIPVKTDGSTKIKVAKDGTVKDLEAGSSVVVQGTPGADGTVKATSVNPGGGLSGGRGLFGGRAGGGTGGGN